MRQSDLVQTGSERAFFSTHSKNQDDPNASITLTGGHARLVRALKDSNAATRAQFHQSLPGKKKTRPAFSEIEASPSKKKRPPTPRKRQVSGGSGGGGGTKPKPSQHHSFRGDNDKEDLRAELWECKKQLAKEKKSVFDLSLSLSKLERKNVKQRQGGPGSEAPTHTLGAGKGAMSTIIPRLKEQLQEQQARNAELQRTLEENKNSASSIERNHLELVEYECYFATAEASQDTGEAQYRLALEKKQASQHSQVIGECPVCDGLEGGGEEGISREAMLEHIAQIQKDNWTLHHQLEHSQKHTSHFLIPTSDRGVRMAARHAAEAISDRAKVNPSDVFTSEQARRNPPRKLILDEVIVAVQTLSSYVGYKLFLVLKSEDGTTWRCWVEVLARSVSVSGAPDAKPALPQQHGGRELVSHRRHQHALKLMSPLQLQPDDGDPHIAPDRHDVQSATIAACRAIVQNPRRLFAHEQSSNQEQRCEALVERLAHVLQNVPGGPVAHALWARLKENGTGNHYEVLLGVDAKVQANLLASGRLPKHSKGAAAGNARGKRSEHETAAAWDPPSSAYMVKCQLFLPVGMGFEGIELLAADVVENALESQQLIAAFFTAIEMGAVASDIEALRRKANSSVETLQKEVQAKEDRAQELEGTRHTHLSVTPKRTKTEFGFFPK